MGQMRLLGRTEVAAFARGNPIHAEALSAWMFEMIHGKWEGPAALRADFPAADLSHLPHAVFLLCALSVQVETVIDFRVNIVLIRKIQTPLERRDMTSSYAGNA